MIEGNGMKDKDVCDDGGEDEDGNKPESEKSPYTYTSCLLPSTSFSIH
jgi:hypothetical protein